MIVELSSICKNYNTEQNEVPVLKDVSLSVEKGDYVAIMGPSGSGKTTLMNVIGCLDVPSSGTYLLDGRDLAGCSDDDLAEIRNKHIGFVFQSFYLLPRTTALDNVALPLLYADVPIKERHERAAEALRAVGLGDRMDFFPNQLSGGQCQRVAIARAMVTHPELLLADEPTGALDTTAGTQIMEIFRDLNRQGVTIIMITHEQAIADCANRIYHILDGRISGSELTDNCPASAESGETEDAFSVDEAGETSAEAALTDADGIVAAVDEADEASAISDADDDAVERPEGVSDASETPSGETEYSYDDEKCETGGEEADGNDGRSEIYGV